MKRITTFSKVSLHSLLQASFLCKDLIYFCLKQNHFNNVMKADFLFVLLVRIFRRLRTDNYIFQIIMAEIDALGIKIV